MAGTKAGHDENPIQPNRENALAGGFLTPLSAARRRRHGEDLEKDSPRYEPVVIGEKAEDEAYSQHEDAEQERVDDGAIGKIVLEVRDDERSENAGGRPGREDDSVDPRHALRPI